jgi:photosystem II oxygen-evolving enhancer protein 3
LTNFVRAKARDLELDQKPRSDGPSRFSFQKLSQKETAARATESVVRAALEAKRGE